MMNHRKWKKSYKKWYGIRPIIFLDKKRKDKAMAMIRDYMSKVTIYTPENQYYLELGRYYNETSIDSKKSMLKAWEGGV